MSTITIEERQMMIDLAKDFISRMRIINHGLKEEYYEFIVLPDNVPEFKNNAINVQFMAYLNGRNTLVSAYNSLEKALEIQKKEIEKLQKQLELEKEKPISVNDASLLIAMSNIYEKARQDYFDASDRLRKNGSSIKVSFSEYLAENFLSVSSAIKIFKEKTNA